MKTALAVSLLLLLASGCQRSTEVAVEPTELQRFPLDNMEQVRATTGVSFDQETSQDGQGSLRVETQEPLVVPLFEVKDPDLEDATLLYQASLQSSELDGQAYLEMWVRLPGKGEFFSRGLDRPVTGTMSWMRTTIPFFLEKGQNPDLVRLNLVVNGKGKVWIDDIRLLKQPLPRR